MRNAEDFDHKSHQPYYGASVHSHIRKKASQSKMGLRQQENANNLTLRVQIEFLNINTSALPTYASNS